MMRPAARPAAAALAMVVAASLVFATVAHAAGLSLLSRSGGVFAQSSARCTDAQLEVTPTGTPSAGAYSEVTITGDLGSCSGGNVSIYLEDASGTVLFSAPVVISGGTGVATGPSFTPPATGDGGVVLGMDGWLVNALWTYTEPEPEPEGPVYPGNPETGLIEINWTLVTNNPVQACFDARVSTTSTSPVEWELEMDLSKAPFNGKTSEFQVDNAPGGPNIGWMLRLDYDVPNLKVRIYGTGASQTVTAGNELLFRVCNWQLPPGAQTPSAYTVDIQQTTWTDARACYRVTVRGNGSSIFYFGHTFEIDMTPARQRLSSFGRYDNPSNNLWMVTRTDLGSNRLRFESSSPANLVGNQEFVFDYCAVR